MNSFFNASLPKQKQQFSFSTFLKEIQTELMANRQLYDSFLNTNILLQILQEFTKLYFDHNSAVQIVNTVLDFMSYCHNESGSTPKLETTFTMNYQRQISQRWQKIREPTYFFNKKQLKIMKYIAKPLQEHKKEKISNFHTFKFDLSIQQARKVAVDVKKMCSIDIRSFAYLSNYLYSSCINLQKFGWSIPKIKQKYEKVLDTLRLENPPAQPIKAERQKLEAHPSFKDTHLIPKIYIDLPKHENEEEKEFALERFIINRANESMNELERFNHIIKQICYRNDGFRFKSGVKIKHKNQRKAMTRIKQKILSNIYQEIQLKEGLSISMKDPSLLNFIDIYSYTTEQYSEYEEKIKKIFSTISQPIPFKVSDLLRGKCAFSSIQKINKCCSDIKQEIKKRENQGIKLIQIDNRLSKCNSDLVMKILFGTTITELQLVVDLNIAQYEFSHKIYELYRSNFYSSLTQLSMLNQDLSKDYFLEVKALILTNNIKKAYDYEEQISYSDPLKSFKEFSHRLEVRINFLDKHSNEIDIHMMKSQINLLQKIRKLRRQKDRISFQLYETYLSNGIYHYQMKQYEKADTLLKNAVKQFEKTNESLIQKSKKGKKINQSQQKTINKYIQMLSYRGFNFKESGKYNEAFQAFQQQLEIETNIKKDNSIAKTFRNLGDVLQFQGEKTRALDYFQRSLEIETKINGQNSFDSALTYRCIGKVYKKQGKIQEALKEFKKCLKIQQNERGQGSIETAITLSYIGNIYKIQENFSQARLKFEQSLEIQQKCKGEGSIDTAITHNNIGDVHSKQRNHEEAIKQYNKCLQIQVKVKGKNCIDTAMTLSKIGAAYDRLGQYEKALQFYEKSIKINKKRDFKFEGYAITLNSMGELHKGQNQHEQAAQCFEKSLQIYNQMKMNEKAHSLALKLVKSLKALKKIDQMKEIAHNYNINPDNLS